MTKMEPLTITQRDAMERIRSVLRLQTRSLLAAIAEHPSLAGSRPTEWVHVVKLTGTHGLRPDTIRALIRKGYLLCRPTDGWGDEVKPAVDWE